MPRATSRTSTQGAWLSTAGPPPRRVVTNPLLVPIAVSSGPMTVPGWTVTRGRPAASSSRPTSSDSTLLRRYGSVQPRSPGPVSGVSSLTGEWPSANTTSELMSTTFEVFASRAASRIVRASGALLAIAAAAALRS